MQLASHWQAYLNERLHRVAYSTCTRRREVGESVGVWSLFETAGIILYCSNAIWGITLMYTRYLPYLITLPEVLRIVPNMYEAP